MAKRPKGFSILIADPDGAEVAGKLRRRGVTVFESEVMSEALALFDSEQPTYVIASLVLGGTSGIALARVMRQVRPAVPVLITCNTPWMREDVEAFGFDFATPPLLLKTVLAWADSRAGAEASAASAP